MRVPILNMFLLAANMLGRLRANPAACPTNSMKLPACNDCTDDPVCEDVITLTKDEGNVLVSIDIQGETCPVNLPLNDPNIETKLHEIVAKYEIDTHVSVAVEDGKCTIRHIGAGTLDNAVVGNKTYNTERCCNFVTVTTYKTYATGTLPDLKYVNADGVETSEAFPNSPYDYAGTAAVDAATAAQLETDLIAGLDAIAYPYTSATVTVSDDDEGFFLCVESDGSIPVMIGSLPFANCGSEGAFVCGEDK